MKFFLKYWLPLLIWLGVIFAGSADLMSAEHTSRFIVPVLRWLNPHISWAAVNTIQSAIRKLGHISEYAILALLLWRAFRSGLTPHRKMSISFGAVLLACTVFAASDEFHQSFVKSRNPSVRDALLDIAGAIFGVLVGAAFAQRRSKKVQSIAGKDVVDVRL
jgi:VanZ family protein